MYNARRGQLLEASTYIKVQGWFCSVITCANVVEVLRIMEEGDGGVV